MKFKIGDEVRVKSLIDIKKASEPNLSVGNCRFVPKMEQYCGVTTIIIGTTDLGNFNLKGCGYAWAEPWLEPATPKVVLPNNLFTLE